MDAQKEDLVAQFSGITGANPSSAQTALQASNWNLEEAIGLFYAANDDGQDAPEAYEEDKEEASIPQSSTFPQPAAPAPSSSSSARRPPGGRPKQMTLEELKKQQEEEDDSDGEKKQDMFAGGEKSGLAVQNPGQGGPADHFRNIMNQARQNRERPSAAGAEEAPQRPGHFTGRAQTLGGDDAESTVIEDPLAAARSHQPSTGRVTRTLHLWADGISIDEGPLYRFDDPANQAMMAEINQGRAPLALLDVRPNQEVDLSLVPHKDENYVAPKQKYKPFAGQGQRLGSPTPGASSSSTAPAAATSQPTSASSQPAAVVSVDESSPTVVLQIRLGDGTRLQSRFNTTHTINDVYAFVDRASPTSGQRPYALMTTFPSKELNDKSAVLGDLSDFKRGGVVVQKYL